MHVKTYIAKDMNDAMRQVREGLGDEAVIISTTRVPGGKGVKVTAAIEPADEEALYDTLAMPRFGNTSPGGLEEFSFPATNGAAAEAPHQPQRNAALIPAIDEALRYHGVPAHIIRILLNGLEYAEGDTLESIVEQLVKTHIDFQPLPIVAESVPLMLIGPPGVGKTLTVAKIATEAVLQGLPVCVITTDTNKAGGVEQLQAFTKILKLTLLTANSPALLKTIVRREQKRRMVIIDTSGVNAYDTAELKELGEWIKAAAANPVLIMAAGIDAAEAGDMAGNFSYLGATELLITKADAARRFGSVLSAAHSGGLALTRFSRNAGVADGLDPIDPHALTQLLLTTDKT